MTNFLTWNWAGEARYANDFAKQVAVGTNADGRLEIFYVGTNDGLYHNWQVAPNAGWAGETRFTNGTAVQLAVGQNADERLEVFYVGANGDLNHRWQTLPNDDWAPENHIDGDSAKQIAVGQNLDGRIEIFYVGTNDDLYHNWQTSPNGVWAGENRVSGDSAKQIAISRNADGRLEIFYTGTNDDLYHNWQVTAGGVWFGEEQFASNSARQIAVGQNADGRLEIFYVGTDNALYHNWQVSSNGAWAGESRMAGESAQQVAVASNQDGRLEVFYVGMNNALYHDWQLSANGNWAGETRFPNNSAKQVAAGRNKDGRLEIFYVGTDDGLYHNWQASPNAAWSNTNGVGANVTAPTSSLGSNSNYILASGCNYLTDVAVTIDVTEDLICQSDASPKPNVSPLSGFTWQLNCYSATAEASTFQQYVIGLRGADIVRQVNNWQSLTIPLLNQTQDLTTPPGTRIPAGYQLRIGLLNDAQGNITTAEFHVIDGHGNLLASDSITLTSLPNVTAADLAPIVAFEMNLVGPGNSDSANFQSGSGTILYESSSPLSVLSSQPPCLESSLVTAETANSFYGALTSGPSNAFVQSFNVSSALPMIRKAGPYRPRLTVPAHINSRKLIHTR